MTAIALQLLSFIVQALLFVFAVSVIRHMVRGYWRKAWAALFMMPAPPPARQYRRREGKGWAA